MRPPRPLQRVFVTGGCGFVGSTLLRRLLSRAGTAVLNYDALTYAGLRESVVELEGDPRYRFVPGDVTDGATLERELAGFCPDTLLHLAAESHVDRSIAAPGAFVQTNVVGTATVLGAWGKYVARLAEQDRDRSLLVHVSTDEVYGPVPPGRAAVAGDPYAPSSPYSATKAAADHLVRSYQRTYGQRSLIVLPTNNYGPRQFPEKLIPLATLRALRREPIPLYGDGLQVRDWLHVDDCAAGLIAAAERGAAGETHHLAATTPSDEAAEWSNRRVVEAVCDAVDALLPDGPPRRGLIQSVGDRPGHDRRYALDSSETREELGWAPAHGIVEGLRETVRWCVGNPDWVAVAERRR